MGDENKIRDAADAAKGLLQAVPVYQDLLQPAVKKLGASLETIMAAVHAALLPVRGLVWGSERVGEYLNAALAEKLKYTPPERIVSPNLAVAGPIVDAMRFVAHEPDLREMYANLLATSMDANIARNAHPAFVEIIRQLTADEAKILEVVAYEESVNISDVFKTEPGSDRPVYNLKYMNLAELSECSFSGLIPSYLDNLRRLGLTQHRNNGRHRLDFNPDGTTRYYKTEGMSFDSPIDDPKLIEVVKLLFADELEDAEGKYVRVDIMSEYVELTFLGGQFAGACILTPDQIELD